MSLTDRMNRYVLVKRSSIVSLKASFHSDFTHDHKLKFADQVYSTTRETQLVSSLSLQRSDRCNQVRVSRTGDCTSMKGLLSGCSSFGNQVFSVQPTIKVQENSPASLSNLLTARNASSKILQASSFQDRSQTKDSQQPPKSRLDPNISQKMLAKFSTEKALNADSSIIKNKFLDKKQIRESSFLRLGALFSPTKLLAESPKVAPHPGDKDIPQVTNHVGLLESVITSTESNLLIQKVSINDLDSLGGTQHHALAKQSSGFSWMLEHQRQQVFTRETYRVFCKPRKHRITLRSCMDSSKSISKRETFTGNQ